MTFVWKITSPMYRPAHKNKPSFQQKGDTLTLFTAVFWNCGRVTPDITGRPLAPSLLLAAHTAPLPHTAHGWTTRQHSQDSGISTEPTTLTCDFHNMLCSLAMLTEEQTAVMSEPQIQIQPCTPFSTGFLAHLRHIGENSCPGLR